MLRWPWAVAARLRQRMVGPHSLQVPLGNACQIDDATTPDAGCSRFAQAEQVLTVHTGNVVEPIPRIHINRYNGFLGHSGRQSYGLSFCHSFSAAAGFADRRFGGASRHG